MRHPTTLGERRGRGKGLLLSVSSGARQNRNPAWDAAAGGEAEPPPAPVHPGKIAQWFGHDEDIALRRAA